MMARGKPLDRYWDAAAFLACSSMNRAGPTTAKP